MEGVRASHWPNQNYGMHPPLIQSYQRAEMTRRGWHTLATRNYAYMMTGGTAGAPRHGVLGLLKLGSSLVGKSAIMVEGLVACRSQVMQGNLAIDSTQLSVSSLRSLGPHKHNVHGKQGLGWEHLPEMGQLSRPEPSPQGEQ